MVFFESKSTDPYYNLALEEYFLTRLDRTQDYFLLWQNDRAVIVGRYQNTIEEIDGAFVREQGIRVARRLSGGGAVYHDLGNLNYTFIVDDDRAERFHFQFFSEPLLAALRQLGVQAQCTGRNDVTIDGKKISGSAQYVRDGRLLHHGCILLDCDAGTLARALRPGTDKIASKSIKSVRSRVTSINEHLQAPISMDRFKAVLLEQVFAAGDPSFATLLPADRQEIRRLRDEKYATWAWNYGQSPRCDVEKKRRFAFGEVSLQLQLSQGVIEDIRIYGDFFGRFPLASLEAMLRGKRLTPEDLQSLADVDLSAYVSGLTWPAFLALLCG